MLLFIEKYGIPTYLDIATKIVCMLYLLQDIKINAL